MQKRYVKGFLAAYYRLNDQSNVSPVTAEDRAKKLQAPPSTTKPWSVRNQAMYLVDSDFDSEDDACADDIEEIISSHVVNNSDASDYGDFDGQMIKPRTNFTPEQLKAFGIQGAPTFSDFFGKKVGD